MEQIQRKNISVFGSRFFIKKVDARKESVFTSNFSIHFHNSFESEIINDDFCELVLFKNDVHQFKTNSYDTQKP